MNIKSKLYRLAELIVLFVLVPLGFTLDFSFWIKALIAILGLVYVIYIILKVEGIKPKINKSVNWSQFWRSIVTRFAIIVPLTHLYVYFLDFDNLYVVIRNKPVLYLVILVVYSVLSAYPQELIYRTFFFSRYAILIRNEKLLIGINAILFSLAHLFFANVLVLILTFLGGILFATTFSRTKSTLAVSIEHAIYGCWLFTVGMGAMLGFPA